MAVIRGTTTDKDGKALPGVLIELKNEAFQTLYETISDDCGRFTLTVPDGNYPFLTAVRDYATEYLEFWAHDVPAQGELTLDISVDTLELYGINAFEVKGPGKALSIYFRPMSLEKFLAGETEIAPEFDPEGIGVKIDGEQAKVLVVNRVQEFAGDDTFLTGYLIQAALPEQGRSWQKAELTLRDRNGSFGSAVLFRET